MRKTRDRDALGLAMALAALATHALAALVPGMPQALDAGARVVAFTLLPGWAAMRILFRRARLGRFETAAIIVGLGVGLTALVGVIAHAARVNVETAGLVLAMLALAALAPRRDQPEPADTTAQAASPQRTGASARAHAGTPAANARTRS